MVGKFSRDKGARIERAMVDLFKAAGFNAQRVPLSGAARGGFKGDVSIDPLLGERRRLEVKGRASGFGQIYNWLSDNYALIVKADRAEPLVILPLKEALRVVRLAEQALALRLAQATE